MTMVLAVVAFVLVAFPWLVGMAWLIGFATTDNWTKPFSE